MRNRISVVIPTYNRPQELQAAVISVLQQSTPVDEILIINDGALEEKVCIYLLSLFSGVQIHHNPQSLGGNFSRNKGARLSTGDILMFLDDDDTWTKDKVAKQLDIFVSDPVVGLVYSNRNVVNSKGEVMRKITSKHKGKLYPQIFYENLIGGTSSVAIRRDVFFKAGAFDEKLPALQDYDLWIRICRISNVGLDTTYSVNYTVSENFKGQVSGSGGKKKEAVKYILNKYSKEIETLRRSDKRKVESNLFFYIAKSYKNTSYTKAVYYSLQSFLKRPNVKSLVILFPNLITNLLRK